jgi:16S rRNA (cytosine967-C5)-methyltransferase
MQNCGSIIACDRAPHRLARLMENLKRLGVKIATPTSHDWIDDDIARPTASFVRFDRILLDAPCSNTGVMRRRVDVRWRLKPNDFGRMQNEQLAIARAVVPLLKPGGVLVYSTCSLEPEENEQVAASLRAEFPNLKAIEQNFVTPFRDGFDGAFAARLTRIS